MDAKQLGQQPAQARPATLHANYRDGVFDEGAPGLTKREAFAMAAMQGLAANPSNEYGMTQEYALDAVRMADALLAELAKGA